MMKALTMIGLSAFLALTACTAATPDGEPTEGQKVKVSANAAADKLDPKMRMRGGCMVNDDETEAICCSEDDCWYVNLCGMYSCR